MSRLFEVKKRDCAARIGELTLRDRRLKTPLIIEAGALVRDGRDLLSALACSDMRILRDDEELMSEDEEREVPRGAVLLPEEHPLYERRDLKNLHVDFFVLSHSSRLLKSPREFASIVKLREQISPDVALWIPAIATPDNIAILTYMGVDIVDNVVPVLRGYDDVFMLEEGCVRITEMGDEQIPCNCEVCASCESVEQLREMDRRERADLIARHNSLVLLRELRKVRMHIISGDLREYVEMRVRSSAFLTAVLRILDKDYEYFFERRAPVARRNVMLANTMESLRRVEVKRFASRVIERYEPPPEKKVLLIIPCAARKPYSLSKSHALFRRAVAGFKAHVHEIIITSPLGIVPREIEIAYPAAFYDIPVTGYWDAEERAWVSSCLRAYLEHNIHKYNAIFVHLEGECAEICRDVAADGGYDMIFTCRNGEKAVSKSALRRLRDEISKFCISEGLERDKDDRALSNVIKALADFQFGRGAGEKLTGGAVVRGKYPRLTLYESSCAHGKTDAEDAKASECGSVHRDGNCNEGCVLARISPEYGMLSITTRGARKLREAIGNAYFVLTDDFVPGNTIFAGGVLHADEKIRVNDYVIFSSRNESVFGVGRAKMSGWEMIESVRGVAVQVREFECHRDDINSSRRLRQSTA